MRTSEPAAAPVGRAPRPAPGPRSVRRARPGRGVRAGPARRADDGFVTAEAAAVVPSLVLLALLLMWAVSAVTAQLRCVDAAWTGARAAARGDPGAAVEAAVRRTAPKGAAVAVRRGGGLVRVRVSARAPVLRGGPWPSLGLPVHAGAAAADEAFDALDGGPTGPGDGGPGGGPGDPGAHGGPGGGPSGPGAGPDGERRGTAAPSPRPVRDGSGGAG